MNQYNSSLFTSLSRMRRGAANLPLVIGGVVVFAIVAAGIWFAVNSAGGRTAPAAAPEAAKTPAQEAATQAAGEANLGAGGGSSTGDTGDTGSSPSNQAQGERNLGN